MLSVRRALPAVLTVALALTGLAVAGPAGASVSFRAPTLAATANAELKTAMAGDFTNDGHQDVAYVNARPGDTGELMIRVGDGHGGFQGGGPAFVAVGDFRAAAVGDFDGVDGDDVAILHVTADGPLLTVITMHAVFDPFAGWLLFSDRYDVAVDARYMTVGDFFGDSKAEIAVSTADGTVNIYDGLHPDTAPPTVVSDPDLTSGPLLAADIAVHNGPDGALDLVATGDFGGTPGYITFLSEAGTLVRRASAAGVDTDVSAAGDFDADGYSDAAASRLSAGVRELKVYKSHETGVGGIAPGVQAVAAGDFSGDGADDIALLRDGSSADAFYYDLDDTPTGMPRTDAPSLGAIAADAADFDEDGRADLLTSQADNTVELRVSDSNDYQVTDPQVPAYTNDTTPTVAFTPNGPGSQTRCALDGAALAACPNDAYTPGAPLADGAHTLDVQEKRAGLTFWSQVKRVTFNVDTAPPAEAAVSPPPTTTNTLPVITFTGVEPGATTECRIDFGVWASCTSPFTPPALADGPHAVSVRVIDRAGNPSSLSGVHFGFTLDRAVPAAPAFTLTPEQVSATARFEFTGEPGASFECRVDSDAYAPCPGGVFEPTLTDGEHTVSVKQTDAAGNASDAAEYTFTYDTAAPAAPVLIAGPPASGTARDVRFQFAGEPGAGFECSLDGAAFAPCASPAAYRALAIGRHAFKVRQRDLAGHTGPELQVRFAIAAPHTQVTPPQAPQPTKVALVTVPRMTVDGGTLTVGCKPDRGTLRSCAVTVMVRSHGKLVRIGSGVASADGAVRVRLTRKGRRLVRRLGGVKVRVNLRAIAADGTVLAAHARVRLLPERVLAVPTDGLFASGESKPLAAGRRYIRRIAGQLDGAKRVTCVGHTDNIGSRAKNRRLGLARAKAVCKLLQRAGVDARLVAASRGETRPRAGNGTRHGRTLNRRVELTVTY